MDGDVEGSDRWVNGLLDGWMIGWVGGMDDCIYHEGPHSPCRRVAHSNPTKTVKVLHSGRVTRRLKHMPRRLKVSCILF